MLTFSALVLETQFHFLILVCRLVTTTCVFAFVTLLSTQLLNSECLLLQKLIYIMLIFVKHFHITQTKNKDVQQAT